MLKFDEHPQVEESQEYLAWVASHDPEFLQDFYGEDE